MNKRRIVFLSLVIIAFGFIGCKNLDSIVKNSYVKSLTSPRFHATAIKGDNVKIKELIDAGADVNKKDEKGITALIYAARYDHPETVELLLKNGADINQTDGTEGHTALYYAAYYDHPGTAEILLKNGADGSSAEYIAMTKSIKTYEIITTYKRKAEELERIAQEKKEKEHWEKVKRDKEAEDQRKAEEQKQREIEKKKKRKLEEEEQKRIAEEEQKKFEVDKQNRIDQRNKRLAEGKKDTFRKTRWGMSVEEVAGIESDDENSTLGRKDDDLLAYFGSLAGVPSQIIYMFEENKLIAGLYGLATRQTANFANYNKFEKSLTKKYGKPSRKDDSFIYKTSDTVIQLHFELEPPEIAIMYYELNHYNKIEKREAERLNSDL
jgi:hypothetical protein